MVTENSLERMMQNQMQLSKTHAEELKMRIDAALEQFGKKDFYEVSIEKTRYGHKVKTRRKDVSPKVDPVPKAQKIIRLRRVG